MVDEVLQLSARAHPAAVVVPDERGYRILIRGRPELAAFEATIADFPRAHTHAARIAVEAGLDLTVTIAALRRVAGL